MQKYDLILWGATSFVGKLIAKYIASNYKDLNWTIAGRDKNKLELLRTELSNINPKAKNFAIIIGDSNDQNFLSQLVKATKIIISTVGPYLQYGEALVKACAENGTDYCDLTGEVPFISNMLNRYATQAEASGSRIIHCCGFDSIPSDLGVFYLNAQAQQKFKESIEAANCVVTKIKGGFSGGTVASIINMIDAVKKDKNIKKILSNPYSICPAENRTGVKQENLINYKYNKKINKWLATFLMSSVNSKVVHASNSLLNYPYSRSFKYTEYLLAKSFLQALYIYCSVNIGMLLLAINPIRQVLQKYLLPKPGQGPSIEQQERGSFEFKICGKTKSDHRLTIKVTGDRDPGYAATAKMIVESAICLLDKPDRQSLPGGFWTPASALGNQLLSRLEENAGMKFCVINS